MKQKTVMLLGFSVFFLAIAFEMILTGFSNMSVSFPAFQTLLDTNILTVFFGVVILGFFVYKIRGK